MAEFGPKLEQPESKREKDPRERILESFERAGLKEKLPEKLLERLILLEENSGFNEDSRRIERGMDNILKILQERGKIDPLNETSRADGRIAALLHDIGKSGPQLATPEERSAVVAVFALKGVVQGDSERLVSDVVADKLGEAEAQKIMPHITSCAVNPQITMRQFWNRHAYWTNEMLSQTVKEYPGVISSNCLEIAASHHIDHGIDPRGLKKRAKLKAGSEVVLQAKIIGALENYVDELEERILMAVDQYEAQVRRSGVSHETAIQWVRNNLGEKFAADQLMQEVLLVIDELGKAGNIFA